MKNKSYQKHQGPNQKKIECLSININNLHLLHLFVTMSIVQNQSQRGVALEVHETPQGHDYKVTTRGLCPTTKYDHIMFMYDCKVTTHQLSSTTKWLFCPYTLHLPQLNQIYAGRWYQRFWNFHIHNILCLVNLLLMIEIAYSMLLNKKTPRINSDNKRCNACVVTRVSSVIWQLFCWVLVFLMFCLSHELGGSCDFVEIWSIYCGHILNENLKVDWFWTYIGAWLLKELPAELTKQFIPSTDQRWQVFFFFKRQKPSPSTCSCFLIGN